MDRGPYRLRAASDADRAWIAETTRDIGGPVVISAGRRYDLADCPAILACRDAQPCGLVIYDIEEDSLVILAIKALEKHRGIGSMLLAESERLARSAGRSAIRLTTTNDNLDALRFYQRRGLVVSAYRPSAFREILRLKGHDPDLQIRGHYGIPIRDEIELVKSLADRP